MCINMFIFWHFPDGSMVKNLPFNAENAGSIPGLEAKISHAVGGTKSKCQNYSGIYVKPIGRSPHTTTAKSVSHSKDPTCQN